MEDSFEQWCLVEIFGHQRIVGKVTNATIGGCAFIRVDVPEIDGQKAFTRYFGNGAIYSMSPVSEDIALQLLKSCRTIPVHAYELQAPSTQPSLEFENAQEGNGDE